jgi:hypothetical protein
VRHGILKILVIALAILVLSSNILNLIQLPRVQASEENNQQQTCNCNLTQTNYPTAAHHITVLGEPESPMIQIEPLSQSNFTSCGCQSCGQTYNNMTVNTTILYQNETYVLTKITYTVNDTVYELLFEHAILYKYSEISSGVNKTLEFSLTKISGGETSLKTYNLIYIVQRSEYTLNVMTKLVPLDSQTYNSSFTIVRYTPKGQNETLSLEFVEFNIPVTLSQLYSVLSTVTKLMSKLYKSFENEDKKYRQLSLAYNRMKMELKKLANIVDLRLQEYNKPIARSYAILEDFNWWCYLCVIPVAVACMAAIVYGLMAACSAASSICGPFVYICFGACIIITLIFGNIIASWLWQEFCTRVAEEICKIIGAC